MAKIDNIFSEDIDIVARDVDGSMLSRLLIVLVTACFLPFIIGPGWALAWPLVAFLVLVWMRSASRQLRESGDEQRRQCRIGYVASVATSAAVWTVLPILYWLHGDGSLRIASIIIIYTQLINAQMFLFRSKMLYIINAGVPALCGLALITLFGDFHGAHLFFMLAVSASALAYLVKSARQTMATDQALREAERRAVAASEAKSAFLAMVSHELRTPLNGLLGMAHALDAMPLNARASGHIQTMLKSGDNLLTLLSDVLDFSKIEAGKMTLHLQAFSLNELFEYVMDLWSPSAHEKGLQLVCDPIPQELNWLIGDKDRIRQIMLNLVSNALKFTEAGTIRIAARPLRHDEATRRITMEIKVTDTGVGLTQDQIRCLFQDFEQAGPGAATSNGTGLGLSICRRLSILMGGDISVYSEPGQGSTFTVRLQLEPTASPSHLDEAKGKAEPLDLQDMRVLIVDDNLINQKVAETILQAWGVLTETAGNGVEALAVLEKEAFDCVLLDLNMPVMDGMETLACIRAGRGGWAGVPVIALTADGHATSDRRLADLGFDDVQVKPMQPAALAAALARYGRATLRSDATVA